MMAMMVCAAGANAENTQSIGGDMYIGGSSPSVSAGIQRDLFAMGFSVSVDADVGKDAHAVGFNIDVDGAIGGDLYAFGSNISVDSTVGEDFSATGFSVKLKEGASVAGNVRMSGATLTIESPVSGSLIAAGGTITLNAPVSGDVRLAASEIVFGDNAVIAGRLSYSASEEIDIPESVISAVRVSFTPLSGTGLLSEIGKSVDKSARSIWPSFFGTLFAFLITLGFLLLVAAAFLSFLPEKAERIRTLTMERPGTMLLLGFLGVSTLFGLVPVSGMTIVGIPLIPVIILAIIALWMLGYLFGVYAIAWRIGSAFRTLPETLASRLAVIAIGLIVAAILNFIPFLGWLVNLAVMLLGLGAITALTTARLLDSKVFASGKPVAKTSRK
jgi:hypothetical protein